MSEISIIPIGSGSTGNCIYIEIAGFAFLVDLGIGYRKVNETLICNSRDISDINAVFVTHGHNDHIKAYQAMCNHLNCKVYANETVMYNIRNTKTERVILKEDTSTSIVEGFKVKMFRVPHDFVRTCAYTFEYKGKKVAYLTDCGRMNNKIRNELYGSDVVIIESNHDYEMLKHGPYPKFLQDRILSEYGHLSNDECADVIVDLYEKGTRNFILDHLSLKNNTPELAYKTCSEKLCKDDAFIYVCLSESKDLLVFD